MVPTPKTDPISAVPVNLTAANSLELIKAAALKTDIKDVAPLEAAPSTRIPPDTVGEIIAQIAANLNIQPVTAMIGIFLLFLKGAANANAPNSMEVKLLDSQGLTISLSKLELLATYKRIAGNNFLRRLAEALACEISQYAENHNLKGELANKLNTKILSEGGVPLNSKEMAWASSFCQGIPNLSELSSDRLPGLLAQDYSNRFSNVKKGSNQPKTNNASKKKGGKSAVKSAPISLKDS